MVVYWLFQKKSVADCPPTPLKLVVQGHAAVQGRFDDMYTMQRWETGFSLFSIFCRFFRFFWIVKIFLKFVFKRLFSIWKKKLEKTENEKKVKSGFPSLHGRHIYLALFSALFEVIILHCPKIDGDWAVGIGNWMWVSSSAFEKALDCAKCMCPVNYGRRMDPTGTYVKRYLPQV